MVTDPRFPCFAGFSQLPKSGAKVIDSRANQLVGVRTGRTPR
jgi:hypothetical protein